MLPHKKTVIERNVVRSAEDPDKRNQRVKFDNITNKVLDKQDKILGMPEVKKAKRIRNPIKENISKHTRSSQEPISNRSRHRKALNTTSEAVNDYNDISYEEIIQNISTTISNEGIVNELSPSLPGQQQQCTESSANRLKGTSDSLKGLYCTIK